MKFFRGFHYDEKDPKTMIFFIHKLENVFKTYHNDRLKVELGAYKTGQFCKVPVNGTIDGSSFRLIPRPASDN